MDDSRLSRLALVIEKPRTAALRQPCNLNVTNNVISALSPPSQQWIVATAAAETWVSSSSMSFFVMSMTHLLTGLSFTKHSPLVRHTPSRPPVRLLASAPLLLLVVPSSKCHHRVTRWAKNLDFLSNYTQRGRLTEEQMPKSSQK